MGKLKLGEVKKFAQGKKIPKKKKSLLISLILYLYEMVDVHEVYWDNHFMTYVGQITVLYT